MLNAKQQKLLADIRKKNDLVAKTRDEIGVLRKQYDAETERANAEFKLSKMTDAEKEMLRNLVVTR